MKYFSRELSFYQEITRSPLWNGVTLYHVDAKRFSQIKDFRAIHFHLPRSGCARAVEYLFSFLQLRRFARNFNYGSIPLNYWIAIIGRAHPKCCFKIRDREWSDEARAKMKKKKEKRTGELQVSVNKILKGSPSRIISPAVFNGSIKLGMSVSAYD